MASADLERDPFPVRIVSFEQTGSHYSKEQGYEYDGRNYFYKFNATTTVELSEGAQNVKDWGYIYHDIYGEDKNISCANLHPSESVSFMFTGPSGRSILLPSHYRSRTFECCWIGSTATVPITTREEYTYRAGYWSSTFDYEDGSVWYLAPQTITFPEARSISIPISSPRRRQ